MVKPLCHTLSITRFESWLLHDRVDAVFDTVLDTVRAGLLTVALNLLEPAVVAGLRQFPCLRRTFVMDVRGRVRGVTSLA